MSQYLEGLNSECGGEQAGERGRGSCYPVLSPRPRPVSFQLDVQGFSHVDDTSFAQYHARWPAKPLAATECCSCETQRGVDNGASEGPLSLRWVHLPTSHPPLSSLRL